MNKETVFSVNNSAQAARVAILAVLAVLATCPSNARAGAFTPGNIVVYRDGTGSSSLVNTGNPVFLDEYTTGGALVQSIEMPTTKNGSQYPLITDGVATSEGQLNNSADGRYLILAGYGTTTGGSSLPGTTSASVPRVIGRVDASGNIDTSTALTDWTSGNNPRSATSATGSTFYGGGAFGNNYASALGNTTSTEVGTQNAEHIVIFNNQLYISSQKGAFIGISTLGSGLPTTTGQTPVLLPGFTSSNTSPTPYGFFFCHLNGAGSSADTLYVADIAQGITKYSLNGGSWVAKGSVTYSSGTLCSCVIGAVAGSTVTLFGSWGQPSGASGGGVITKLVDSSGYNGALSGTPAAIITAATDTAIRGVALAPITAPFVTTSAATSIGNTGATLNGSVTNDGGTALTDYGFYWSTTSPVTTSSAKAQVGTADYSGAYTANLAGVLSPNTEYYYRAYANNSVGNTLGGSDVVFYTLANTPAAPVVGNNPTPTTLDVTIGSGDGNPVGTTYAIQETGSGQYVQANGARGGTAVFQTASAWGSINVTGLSPGTPYTFQVEARNGAGVTTGFGPTAGGATSPAVLPTITVSVSTLGFPPTLAGGVSANLTYTVSGQNLSDNIVITAPANFEISTDGSTFDSTVTLTQSGGTVSGTTIYVQFQPAAQTSYSGNITHSATGANDPSVAVSGLGANLPSVTTQTASSITTSGATLNGAVTSSNNAPITDRGFYWSASPGVTASATQLSAGGTTAGAFSKSLTGLSVNTVYYYRAYAVNSIGVTLDSSDSSFFTLANTPAAPVVNSPAANSLNVAIGSGDGNPAGTTYAIEETNGAKYVQAGGALGATAVYQTAAAWNPVTVTGLGRGRSYGFAVQAANGAGVVTAFGPATIANTANTAFTPGDLAVVRLGDGTQTLSADGNSVFIDEYSTNGTLVQSFPLPDGGASPVVIGGTAASEGALARSLDGSVLSFPGYQIALAGSSSSLAGSSVPRAACTMDVNGNFIIAASTASQYSADNFRGVATDGTNNFWGAGSAGGTCYLGTASTPAVVQTANPNTKVVSIFNGNLYFSTGASAGDGPGIYGFSGLPVSTAPATGLILPGASASPYGFSFSPDGLTAYVADEVTGISKWTNSGASWSQAYSFGAGTASRGLVADWGEANPVLYASTTNTAGNALIKLVDAGAGSSPVTLAAAVPNTVFRGVAFAPKAAQSITFASGAMLTNLYGASAFSDGAAAASGLTVTYSSDNTSVATVDSSGTVTIVGAGAAHILANQTGNNFYYAAPQVSQSLTINPLPVTLSGSRPYNGTAGASASILTIANNLDGANLTLSGSATVAGNTAGLQPITDFSGLTLGGSAAGNYTLTGAGGSVTISPATPVTITVPLILSDGTVQLTFSGGDAGVSYRIQARQDLITGAWTTLFTNLAGAGGLLNFIDSDATNHLVRYYRTITP